MTPLDEFLKKLSEEKPELFSSDLMAPLVKAILDGPPEVAAQFMDEMGARIRKDKGMLN